MIHSIRWTLPKIEQRLRLIEPLVYRQRLPLPSFRYRALSGPAESPPVATTVADGDWAVIEPYTYWGPSYTDFVLRSSFAIPRDWPRAIPLAIYLPLGDPGDFSHPEALIYIDGSAYAACDRNHQEVLLRADWQDGATHTLALHGWTGLGDRKLAALLGFPDDVADGGEFTHQATPASVLNLLMQRCELVQIDQPTRDFVTTVRVLLGTAKALDEDAPARGKLLYALDQAFKLLDTREPFGEAFYDSVTPALTALRAGLAQAGAPLDVHVGATGHAHIDVAWLWTLGQTRRKAGRSFHTVIRLMEQFPDYHFTQSQPQLYDYIRQDYPALFEDIKRRVAEGSWEAIGGMWVEADCNLSGPESLARQFLLGRSFFEKHFGAGVETPVLWLPDVFGYAWALPQLIKQAGLEYFFTIKIGWSQYNRLPYDSFWWQGIDGTRVLTHFSTTPDEGEHASTYNASATPEQLLGTWTNFRQKDLGRGEHVPPLLMAYGFGDGGGGPTREMLENIQAMAALPAMPQIRQQRVGDFFRELETTSGDILPTWNGELYLELHRGTYTTQGRNKRANRASEFLLHDAEYLAVLASLLDASYAYPEEALRYAWELVCLNQFHDIIPGSSINPVYKESQLQYAQVSSLAREATQTALQSIARHYQGDLLVANATSFEQGDLAFWPGQLPPGHHLEAAHNHEPLHTQATEQGTWIAARAYAPLSVTPVRIVPGEIAPFTTELTVTPTLLENRYVRIELNADGDITSIFDKVAGREVVAPGRVANQLQAFEDRPQNWDAWDVDIYYDDRMWVADPASSVQVVERGPLRATLLIERRILHSSYQQRITLRHNSSRLDIETSIDWRERHIFLKAAFPVDILSPAATYEIQWGNVQRPTHRNTSWDWARFETCAQKWVDLSEGGYGVSVLNNGKYGHDIHDNVIRVSLLRSPTMPDPQADQGQHIFTCSLLPHVGSWNESTIAAAYGLNDPLLVYAINTSTGNKQSAASRTHVFSLIAAEQPNIVIETIKRAEDGNGIIVRLYESQRRRGPITLTSGIPLKAAWHTNLLEHNEHELQLSGRQLTFSVHPYEIVTLRLIPA
ncbi:MAG: alpha-mannosidase [Ktedonobacteraceae bacterium]